MDDLIPFGSRLYWLFLALLAVSRGLDFLSTWLATPRLQLEANPIARRLGWRWGAMVNTAACLVLACWPLPAVIISTTSVLVAARNFQSAWLMRSLGEARYRAWIAERLSEANRAVFIFCLLAQAVLFATLGGILIGFSQYHLVPFGVGTGIVAYAITVALFSLLSALRMWRSTGLAGGALGGR